ncbi:MAG: Wzz/FepE/Etk N-terminal domain-containing protein, partial [Flavobacteriaceae bacterium]
MNQKKVHIEEDSIDLVALLKSLWVARKLIVKWTSGFVVVGVGVALLSSTSYTASTTFIPQTSGSDGASSSLSGLASLAGINLGGVVSGGEIPPSLYPQLLEAVPVKREILAIQVPTEMGMISYSNYLSEAPTSTISQIQKYTIGLPFTILKALRSNEDSTTNEGFESIIVSEEEKELFEILENNIELNVNEQEGFVDLSITDANAVVATVLTKNIKSILQEKIIAYKVQYAKEF